MIFKYAGMFGIKTMIFVGIALCLVLSPYPGHAEDQDYRDCLRCHHGIEKISDHHLFPCGSCHLPVGLRNQKFLKDHVDIVRNPSAPENVNAFCGRCHAKEIRKMKASIHYTAAGIINQTRYLWGAQEKPSPARYRANDTGVIPELLVYRKAEADPASLVDDLLRRKCLRCHVGIEGVKSRGFYHATGCAACHVIYDDDGLYRGRDPMPHGKTGFPSLHRFSRTIPNRQCLHCHNGNRVGSDYEGLFQHDYDQAYRSPIMDGRYPSRIYGMDHHTLKKDIHAQKGLECVDCHGSREVMGDEILYSSQAEVPKVKCGQCHGDRHSLPDTALRGVTRVDGQYFFTTRKGQRFRLSRFSSQVISHRIKEMAKIGCSACHARWSFQDYGLSLMRDDSGDYSKWARLRIQGDPILEQQLRGFFRHDRPVSHTKEREIGPESVSPGPWYMGWRFRRWEFMPLGVNRDGRVAVLRPLHQYRISYIDSTGRVLLDSVTPLRGDLSGKGWAFAPYNPHTIGARGRNCEACHLNPMAAGLGVFTEQTTGDALLTLPDPPVNPGERLLNKNERQILINKSAKYRRWRYLDLLDE